MDVDIYARGGAVTGAGVVAKRTFGSSITTTAAYENHNDTMARRNSGAFNSGMVFGLLGTNGCGKTSLYKMIMGLETVSSGDIFVQGKSVSNAQNMLEIRRNSGYCPQENTIPPKLTVETIFTLFARVKLAASMRRC